MLALFFAFACTEPTIERFEDTGVFCFDTTQGTYAVDFQTCLSSSCDRVIEASCTIESENGVLVVHATAEVERATSGTCTDDCRFLRPSCELPDLDDTEGIDFVYGSTRTDISDIPSCD